MRLTRDRRALLLAAVAALLFVVAMKRLPRPFTLRCEVQTTRCANMRVVASADGAPSLVSAFVDSRDRARTFSFPLDASRIDNITIFVEGDAGVLQLQHVRVQPLFGAAVDVTPEQMASAIWRDAATNRPDVAEFDTGREGGPIVLNVALPSSRAVQFIRAGIDALLAATLVALMMCVANARADRLRLSPLTVVIALFAVFVIASACGLHGSSTPIWRYHADRAAPHATVLCGTPRQVRMDEWLVETPWILSQAQQRPAFPLHNPNVGGGDITLLNNLPVRHWSMVFRPQMWAFFVLGVSRAFAWYWNCKWLLLLGGSFLFFYEWSRRRVGAALLGTLLFCFSPFVQWWFSTPTALPELLGNFFLALWSVRAAQRAERAWWRWLAAGVLPIAAVGFVCCSYPRFQVPLLWLGALLMACEARAVWRSQARTALVVACASATILVTAWFATVWPLIREVSALAYPGKVLTTGGTMEWHFLTEPFLEMFATVDRLPLSYPTIYEAANFLFVMPLAAACVVMQWRQRRLDAVAAALLGFAAVFISFAIFSWPVWLAKATGFAWATPARAQVGLGVASLLALCRCVTQRLPVMRTPRATLVAFGGIALLLAAVLFPTNARLAHFVSGGEVVLCALYFAAAAAVLWQRQIVVAGVLTLVPQISATATANPIVHGLDAIFQTPLVKAVTALEARARGTWIVVGTTERAYLPADLLKATGASVLGGTLCTPDPSLLQTLDPSRAAAEITSRYGIVNFAPTNAASPTFELTHLTAYRVHLPYTNEMLQKVGADRVLEVDTDAGDQVPAGFMKVDEGADWRILARTK